MPTTSAENPTLKIALAQIDVEPNRPDSNARKIREIIQKQREQSAQLIVFPELAVPGYMIGDKWQSKTLMEDLEGYNDEIAQITQGVTAIWGNVIIDPNKINRDGSVRKYNAAVVAQNGLLRREDAVFKTNLPTYRQFHDQRHFTSLADLAEEEGLSLEQKVRPVEFEVEGVQYKIGILLCEDMWWKDYGAKRNVAEILRQKGADFLVNLSCSPWGLRKNDKRHRVVGELFPADEGIPFLYVNNVGVQDIGKTVMTFDGGTTLYGAQGKVLREAEAYKENVLKGEFRKEGGLEIKGFTLPEVVEQEFARAISEGMPIEQQVSEEKEWAEIKEIKQALIEGLRAFAKRIGKKKVLLGLSGGIDSAVAAALWVEALGAENVYAVNLPTKFNSGQTKDAAYKLAKNLGIHYGVLPIQKSFSAQVKHLEDFHFDREIEGEDGKTEIHLSGLNKENIQARIRGSGDLIGLASAIDAVVSCNGNKTEFAFGYATLYGDIIGSIAPLGDLLKKQVYRLARFMNLEAGKEIIPRAIIEDIPASAELSEEQNVDEGKGDPFYYDYHDQMVKYFVEYMKQPEDLLEMLIDGTIEEKFGLPVGGLLKYFGSKEKLVEDLEDKWRRFHINVFKRYQAPPVIKVSSRCFGYDFHESQVSAYFSRGYGALKERCLKENS